MFAAVKKTLQASQFKYLFAGAWNTVFGYLVGVFIFKIFEDSLSIISIGILANILSISMSFTTYKLFVFKTRGRWIQEYLKSYLVYGGMAILNIIFLDILIRHFNCNIWLAQAILLTLSVTISFFGHKNFTFK